jgi:hypothetical protein
MMTPLPAADRLKCYRAFMRFLSHWETHEDIPNMVKQDLIDAINSTDDWIEANVSSYNNSLPTLFRTNATPSQKTLLFCFCAAMRYADGFLRRLFGEVD